MSACSRIVRPFATGAVSLILSLAPASTAHAQSSGCEGDLNNDGIVDASDLGVVLGSWGACPPPPPPPPPPAAASVFLVIDGDSIAPETPPNFFTSVEVNDTIAAIGQRSPLPAFSGVNIGTQLTLWTGEVGDEGWFALKSTPGIWSVAGPTTDGLRNYVLAGQGLGSGPNPEAHLDNVGSVTPLRATGLSLLEGQTVCAVVYKGDIAVNYNPMMGSLKGDNLGVVAFKVIDVTQLVGQSSGSLPQVLVEIVDPVAAFAGALTLFTMAPEPISSSLPYDIVPTQ